MAMFDNICDRDAHASGTTRQAGPREIYMVRPSHFYTKNDLGIWNAQKKMIYKLSIYGIKVINSAE